MVWAKPLWRWVYLAAACRRGENCTIYEFDERVATLINRAEHVMAWTQSAISANGQLLIDRLTRLEISPGAFACVFATQVETRKLPACRCDSPNGYMACDAAEQH